MVRLWLILLLLGFRVSTMAWRFRHLQRRKNQFCANQHKQGPEWGVGGSFQHRTNSSKELCGLHLQGNLPPPQPTPRSQDKGTCELQRQRFLGFPQQHRLPPRVLLMGAFVAQGGGTSVEGACAKGSAFPGLAGCPSSH